ncbi:MAG: bifunctional (p)ppGpp synthetase/guanosine-3',5'-bis(diphosphate) 3'-pyrophosphohydrolase [Anaerolineae bacterium]|nr:bifunctional (p)ppGpp synthetase/guanosine-3',5'-bis(diphosphate) 3'-pyrophosphohydrolase [Anaerolineae bacterium]
MLDQPIIQQHSPTSLGYLPAHFSEANSALIQALALAASQHILRDEDSSITPEVAHQVARTLISADCDARTLMIFFLSLLDATERQTFAPLVQDPELLEAAHSVSIIRLLSAKDHPKHLPIRKVLLRQLVLKATHDVRVILIKIAGRLVTLRHAGEHHWDLELRQRLAHEALDVVVPWCDALGLDSWRQELQELSFRYLNPAGYAYVLSLVRDQRDHLHAVRDQVIQELSQLLARHGIQAQVSGRVKTHFAIYRKMTAYELSFDEVWDRLGIRILTKTVFDCYYAQMAIEEELYPERHRFVDYIENRAPLSLPIAASDGQRPARHPGGNPDSHL